jgi:hypothetical protein
MAALALPAFQPAAALTENQFEPRWDHSAASLAALTKPRTHVVIFPSKGNAYRIVVTTNQTPTPAWIEPTISAFIGVQSLPDNWNSYGAKKVNGDLISRSLAVLELIMEATSPPPSVVPLADGGLQLEWHRKHQDLEIAFTADETAQFYYENKTTGLAREGFASDVTSLTQLLRNIA